jgi:arabinose-5-phosphate isomerase
MLERTSDVSTIKAKDITTHSPKTILPELLAVEAFEMLKQFDINQLIIVDSNDIYLGIIHLHDLIREGIF